MKRTAKKTTNFIKQKLKRKELKRQIGKLSKLIKAFMIVIVVILIGIVVYISNPDLFSFKKQEVAAWHPKDVEAEIARGFLPKEIQYGHQLLSETQKYLGPQAEDPEMRISGNNMSCTSCHLQAGNQAGAASWAGVTTRYPSFRGRSNAMGTIEDRINGCLERSMNGKRLDPKSKPMKAMVAYMEWLGEDMPEDKMKYYEGFTSLEIPEVAVDLDYGKQIYVNECMLCHQEDGQGVKNSDFSLGYQYPPLWGEDSYNDGAGMHRVLTAAAFIKANMPFEEATKDNPKLTDEESFHVAGYINSLARPSKSDKEYDFPDKKLKPVSTPYGPWEDDFSAEQHKYGPFPPIIAYYKYKFGIEKTN